MSRDKAEDEYKNSFKYEYLEDAYDDLPKNERIQRSMDPEGSITDFRRGVEPRRNRAHKKLRELARKLKETQDDAGTKEW